MKHALGGKHLEHVLAGYDGSFLILIQKGKTQRNPVDQLLKDFFLGPKVILMLEHEKAEKQVLGPKKP